jgi:DNA helicase-2/ATP-dependent DNA helicase PcrA
VKYGEIAILMRAGFQSRAFEERFMAHGLPYRVIGGLRFYERQEIKDIVAYLRLIYQPNDSLAFERIINIPKRGIGASAMAKFHALSMERNISLYYAAREMLESRMLRPSLTTALRDFFQLIETTRLRKDLRPADMAKIVLEETGYFSALSHEQTIEAQSKVENLKELLIALEDFEDLATFIEHISLVLDSPKNSPEEVINIMTLHGAKGLEFDAVFLVGWEEGVFPHNLSIKEENVEEERRLGYVGITRAKKYAFISYARNRKIYNQWQSNLPSRFLSELPEEHIHHIKHFSRVMSAND